MNMLEVASSAFKGIVFCGQGYKIYNELNEILNRLGNDDRLSQEERITLLFKSINTIAQVANLSSVAIGNNNFRLGANIFSNLTNITETAVQRYTAHGELNRNDALDITRETAVGATESLLIATTTHPQFCEHNSGVLVPIGFASALVGGVLCDDRLLHIVVHVGETFSRVLANRVLERFHFDTTLSTLQEQKRLLSESYTFCTRIPFGLEEYTVRAHKILQHTCLISQRAIRCVVVPNVNTHKTTTFYEKEEAEKWVKEKSNEAPPGWPTKLLPLPLKADYFFACPSQQNQVDRSIKRLMRYLEFKMADLNRKKSALNVGFFTYLGYKLNLVDA